MKNEELKKNGSGCLRTFLISSFFLLHSSFFPCFAHDPLEISATVYLHTNRVELRAVMLRKVVMLAADHQGVPLLDFSIPAEREEALPMLHSLAPTFFTLSCGTNTLRATETKITLGAEDHVGVDLTYATGLMDERTNGVASSIHPSKNPNLHQSLTLIAPLLAHLPKQDLYGVNVTVLDMVNNQVVEQKLLNVQTSMMEIVPPKTLSTNSPPRHKI